MTAPKCPCCRKFMAPVNETRDGIHFYMTGWVCSNCATKNRYAN